MSNLAKLAGWGAGVYCALALASPGKAEACGGTFCDGGNNGMPVDQTGENIVFVQGGGFVEAHVQISYDGGDAAQFSWIVPVPVEPEIEVGSLQFVENLRAATVPTYGLTTVQSCDDFPDTGIGFLTDPDGGGVSGEDPPEVLELSTVGAFDYVVLQGGTPASMLEWLDTNGYTPDPAAEDIFATYLDAGSVFVAFKLNHLSGIDDLHPVVIRYEGTEPCIPIQLTRVAAREDMDIRAFFLGEDRVLPTNYKHVSINRTQLDWLNRADNYGEVVSAALDEAGGRAFMTEYAGASDVVATDTLSTADLDATAFADIDPLTVVNVLIEQGLAFCGESCSYGHELVPLLLREFLPPPAGVDADTFYACPQCYAELADTDAWDADAFEARYREYIVDPMAHADDLLVTWPYLTRLYSRLSPSEMTVDPMFAEVAELGVVPNRLGAQRDQGCCETTVQLPSGRVVAVEGAWPSWSDAMPFAMSVEQYQPNGPPAVELDNSAVIDAELALHNEALACERGASSSGSDGGGPSATGVGDDGGSPTTGPSNTSGMGTSGTGSGGSGGLDTGRGCSVPRDAPGAPLFLRALLGLRRRRS